MQLQVLQVLPNGALNCQLTLTRANSSSNAAGRGSHQTTITGAWGTAAAAAGAAGTTGSGAAAAGAPAAAERKIYTSFTPCKLLCGCSSTDQLLLMRSIVLETFESPMQVSGRPWLTSACNRQRYLTCRCACNLQCSLQYFKPSAFKD
jgi:hypothetical protein